MRSKDAILKQHAKNGTRATPEITRFKGLGEMMPKVLWETTLNPRTRRLLRVEVTDQIVTDRVINELMGKDASARFRFIMERADEAEELDVVELVLKSKSKLKCVRRCLAAAYLLDFVLGTFSPFWSLTFNFLQLSVRRVPAGRVTVRSLRAHRRLLQRAVGDAEIAAARSHRTRGRERPRRGARGSAARRSSTDRRLR